MQDYQNEFIEFAIRNKVLCFGEFTLKSGRISPYFFNSGLFNTGSSLGQLGRFYAQAIQASGLDFDMLFGPAYKGIPLVSAVSIALAERYNRDLPYCFDRKEAKVHGEGGLTVGAPLQGGVLIIDDVISAGTSVNRAVEIIHQAGASPAGVAIALDRQERGQRNISAVDEVEREHEMEVISIVALENLIEFLEKQPAMSGDLDRIHRYRDEYGVRK